MTKQHFIWFANYIRQSATSDAEREAMIKMVVEAGHKFNSHFDAVRFRNAVEKN